MIETPRAALVADRIADVAEFFSFGTNDLTQLIFGFSRDDAEGQFLPQYLDRRFCRTRSRRSTWMVSASSCAWVRAWPATRADIELGICGEHGGDPESVAFCHKAGLTTSCSPFRVPIARLAAAHAVLGTAGRPLDPNTGSRLNKEEISAFLDEVFPGAMEHFTIEAVGPMHARIRMPFQTWRLRPGGHQRPVADGVGRHRAWVALLAMIGREPLSVTSHLDIDFLRKPAPVDVIAHTTLHKFGSRLVVGDVSDVLRRRIMPCAPTSVTYAFPFFVRWLRSHLAFGRLRRHDGPGGGGSRCRAPVPFRGVVLGERPNP